MTTLVNSFALWLADYYLLATLLLAGALTTCIGVKQPVQRLAIARSTIAALALLAALCALPGWSLFHLLTVNDARVGVPLAATGRLDTSPPAMAQRPTPAIDTPTLPNAESANATLPSPTAPFSEFWSDTSLDTVLVMAYGLGAASVVAWLVLGSVAAHRLCRSATPAPTQLVVLLNEMTAAHGGTLPAGCHWLRQCFVWNTHQSLQISGADESRATLLVSDKIDVAAALGVFRPVVLLPSKWIEVGASGNAPENCTRGTEGLSHDALRSVLAHETAHIRNGDLRWLAASRSMLILLWAQPLYWLLRRRLRADQELLADAAAAEVTSRQRYAEQLVAWARNVSARPAVRLSAAVGLWKRPSQLHQRIALLLDERFTVLRNCSPQWRGGSTACAVLAPLFLSLATIEPPIAAEAESPALLGNLPATQTAEALTSPPQAPEGTPQLIDFPIIVAEHVMLSDGKIIEWADVERRITALPNPQLAHPSLKFTHGALPERQEEIRAKIWDLRKRVELLGHSWGSLLPRASARYDAIRTMADLVPNAAHRVQGIVVTGDGRSVDGAEVVLLPPAPDSVPYKTLDVYLRNERLRTPDDEIATRSDAAGQFAVYPPPGTPYQLVALHREGFGLVRSDEFATSNRITIRPWAHVKGSIRSDEQSEQSANVSVRVPAEAGWPEITFHQYSVDLGPPLKDGSFELAFVPPALKGTLSRHVKGAEGTSYGLPVQEFELAPGETLAADIGLPSEADTQQIEDLKSRLQQQRDEASTPSRTE